MKRVQLSFLKSAQTNHAIGYKMQQKAQYEFVVRIIKGITFLLPSLLSFSFLKLLIFIFSTYDALVIMQE